MNLVDMSSKSYNRVDANSQIFLGYRGKVVTRAKNAKKVVKNKFQGDLTFAPSLTKLAILDYVDR